MPTSVLPVSATRNSEPGKLIWFFKAEGECHHTTNSSDNTLPTDSCVRNTDELPARFEESGESKVDQFDLALAAMAGFSMEIAPDILWDNGYQLLWENAALNITTTGCGPCTGTVSYGDTLQHHFRTGLRFNVNGDERGQDFHENGKA